MRRLLWSLCLSTPVAMAAALACPDAAPWAAPTVAALAWLLTTVAWMAGWRFGLGRRAGRIISGAGAGLLITDEQGRVTAYNRDSCRILDMPEHAIQGGLGWIARIDEQDLFRVKLALRRTGEQVDATGGMEVRVVHLDGEVRNVLLHVMPHDAGAGLNVVSLVDITERKRVMEVLRQREQLMEDVLANIDDGLAVFDAALNVTHWNAAMERLTALPEGVMMAAEDPGELLESCGFGLGREFARRALAGEEILLERRMEVASRNEPGILMIMARPLRDAGGEICGVLAVLRDVTDVRQAEKATLAAKKMAESANAAKTEFLANVSHELRTPMNGLTGLLNLLLAEPLAEQHRQWLTLAVEAAGSLTRVINTILEYTDMESGLTEAGHQEMNPIACARDALLAIEPAARAKGISTEMDCDAVVPDRVCGDPNRLRQVLQHVLNNAVKFSSSGHVKVAIAAEGPGADDESLTLRFDISDNGIGVPEQRRESIFDAFTQADGSSTRHFGGTGLGLAICRKLLRQMEGDIHCLANPAGGSIFRFTLRVGLLGPAERREGDDAPQAVAAQTLAPLVDLKLCLSRLDGDADLLAEIAGLFIEDAPGRLEEIAAALNAGDGLAVASAAHSLKGAASNFEAEGFIAAAKQLERLARDEDLSAARAELDHLKSLTEAMTGELKTFLAQNSDAPVF